MTTQHNTLPTPTNQGNIVQFNPHKQPTWMQQAKRLHDDGNENFSEICSMVRWAAQMAAFPNNNSFSAMVKNMEGLKQGTRWFEFASEKIEEIYNESYSIPDMADVIPFPSAQGGV